MKHFFAFAIVADVRQVVNRLVVGVPLGSCSDVSEFFAGCVAQVVSPVSPELPESRVPARYPQAPCRLLAHPACASRSRVCHPVRVTQSAPPSPCSTQTWRVRRQEGTRRHMDDPLALLSRGDAHEMSSWLSTNDYTALCDHVNNSARIMSQDPRSDAALDACESIRDLLKHRQTQIDVCHELEFMLMLVDVKQLMVSVMDCQRWNAKFVLSHIQQLNGFMYNILDGVLNRILNFPDDACAVSWCKYVFLITMYEWRFDHGRNYVLIAAVVEARHTMVNILLAKQPSKFRVLHIILKELELISEPLEMIVYTKSLKIAIDGYATPQCERWFADMSIAAKMGARSSFESCVATLKNLKRKGDEADIDVLCVDRLEKRLKDEQYLMRHAVGLLRQLPRNSDYVIQKELNDGKILKLRLNISLSNAVQRARVEVPAEDAPGDVCRRLRSQYSNVHKQSK